MMPFHRRIHFTEAALAITLTALTLSIGSPKTLAEPIDDSGAGAAKTNVAPQDSLQGFTARKGKKSGTSREWSRSPARPEPLSESASANLSGDPKIRFASASGYEETAESAAAPVDDQGAPAEAGTSAQTSSLSVKEQLLNALRAQREGSVGAARSSSPGSLTILNSPSAAPGHLPPEPSQPATATIGEETDPAGHSPQANTAQSRIGLTRTLEKDLKSPDPYVRERAHRYLRLEMQLLKLRANQEAHAELSRPNSNLDTQQAAVEAEAERSDAVVPPPQLPDHPELHEGHPAENTDLTQDSLTADAAAAEHTEHDEHVRSPHASLIDNIVVDGPIDRLGLANNLFAVGEYPLALEMYQQIDQKNLKSHEYFWVEYQTANCLRRLGRPAEASNRYRKLASQPEAGWLSQQANWWAETLEKIRRLEAALADNSLERQRATIEDLEGTRPQADAGATSPSSSQSIHEESKQDEHAH